MPMAAIPPALAARRARELEALGFLHMAVQQPLGTGYASAVTFLA